MGKALTIALSLYATLLIFENHTGRLIASVPVDGTDGARALMARLNAEKDYRQSAHLFEIGCRPEFCCRFKFTLFNYPPIIEPMSNFCSL